VEASEHPAQRLHEERRVTALDGVRVLDLSDRLSGAYAARLFGDFGADVTLGEPPEGHALRSEPPFLGREPGVDRSLLHAYANLNKRSVVVRGVDHAAELAATADVLVTTASPRLSPSLSSSPQAASVEAATAALPTEAVHLSITAHGLTGPLATRSGNHLTAFARSGWADINGFAGHPPLQHPPHQAGYLAGVLGFVAAAALLRSPPAGERRLVDLSEAEAVAITAAPWALAATYEGPGGPTSAVYHRSLDTVGPIHEASDGRVYAGFGNGPFWRDAMHILGLPELAENPLYEQPAGRVADQPAISAAIAERIAALTRWEVFERLSAIRCVSGVVQSAADLLANEQLADRGYFATTSVEGRSLRVPGAAAMLSASPATIRSPAPRLDEHRDDHREDRSRPPSGPAVAFEQPARAGRDSRASGGPLAGVRVLTFTQAWAGPWGTELLAMLGADVVQIEARRRPDIWRTYGGAFSLDAPVPDPIRDAERRQRPWNTVGLYNAVNMGKRGITLDMTQPQGAELFWRLVPRFDVVAESFNSHVMENWGVTFERLREHRPDVIFASLAGYGGSGPYARYAANGATIEPMSGLTALHGYEGGLPQNTGGLFPDPVSGSYLAAAILAALHHRDRSGEGQRIDVSMMEAMAAHVGDAVLEFEASGDIRGPIGNRHPRVAPHGIYPARDGRWIALAAETDEAWLSLCTAIDRADLAGDERLGSMAGRKRHEDELDAAIAAWTAGEDAEEAAERLGLLGVTAARVVPLTEVFEQPSAQLRARGFVVEIEHPEAGRHGLPRAPWVLGGSPAPTETPTPSTHTPMMGEHSFEVLSEELGVTAAEYERLVALGVTGEEPPD
jgi:crotonobetainyl-CoA:carnitine CoA-transferase CaiB-like acyl-CoA transferase